MNFRLSVKQSCSARCFKSLSLVRCFVCASCPRVAVARVNYFCSTAELELPDSTNKAERCTRPSFLKSKGKVTVSVNLPESNKEVSVSYNYLYFHFNCISFEAFTHLQ